MRIVILLVALASAATAQPIDFEPLDGPFYRGLVHGSLSNGTLVGTLDFGRLARSVDDGATWERVESAPNSVGTIRLLPDDSILLTASGSAGEGGGLFRSEDGGETWANVGPPEVRATPPLAVDAAGTSWAVALGADLLVTTDAGATWTTHPPTLDDHPILSLTFDDQGRVLVTRYNENAVNSQVERWDGTTWTEAQTPRGSADNVKRLTRLPDGRVAAISVFYQSPIFSWFQRRPALYLSDNGGDSWDREDSDRVTDVTQRADGALVIGRPNGVDGPVPPLPVPAVGLLSVGADGSLFANSLRAGAFRLRPGADAWEQAGTTPAALPLVEVQGRLVAGGDGVLVVHDGGVWRPVPWTLEQVDALDATASGRLLVSTQSGLYAVDALGEAPRPLAVCGDEPCAARGVAQTPSGALLAAAGCGLYRSTDDGDSWTQVLDEVNLRNPAAGPGLVLAGEASRLFGGCSTNPDRSLFASTDDGLTWSRRESGIDDLRGGVTLVTETGTAYAGTYSGVYRLGSSGVWQQLSARWPFALTAWDARVWVGFEDGLGEVVGGAVEPAGLDGVTTLRFVVRENGSLVAGTSDGAFESVVTTSVASEVPVEGVRIVARGANPARSVVRLSVEASTAGSVEVAVFDALGRRLAVLHDGPARGEIAVVWAAPASGVYVVRAQTARAQASRAVTVVR